MKRTREKKRMVMTLDCIDNTQYCETPEFCFAGLVDFICINIGEPQPNYIIGSFDSLLSVTKQIPENSF